MSKPLTQAIPLSAFWFRRDLRLEDNVGLQAALSSGRPVLAVFIFDQAILNSLADKNDSRVTFIHRTLESLDQQLRDLGSALHVEVGRPIDAWKKILTKFPIAEIFTNHDFEPKAIDRDNKVIEVAKKQGVGFQSFKDQVIFEKSEVTKDDGKPYTVFTPFSRKWIAGLIEAGVPKKLKMKTDAFLRWKGDSFPSLVKLGFTPTTREFPASLIQRSVIEHYEDRRDTPSIRGTSHLGLHFRFGTVSVRDAVRTAIQVRGLSTENVWLKELVWREFFSQILWHFPHVVEGPFKPDYEKVKFRHDNSDFAAWCEGRTGYPIVDAGLRELNATGFMHNRVRMITASFLVKHLLIDYRWGEAYFARQLLDFELASNNGNWQWVTGCGCDASPYFRIFNPITQEKKFDPQQAYIRQWIPEFGTSKYPAPMIDHVEGRTRALYAYQKGLSKKAPASSRTES